MSYLVWGWFIGVPLGLAIGLVLNKLIYNKILKPKGMCSMKELINSKEKGEL